MPTIPHTRIESSGSEWQGLSNTTMADDGGAASSHPVRGSPFNKWLPYADHIDEEARVGLQDIVHGLGQVIAHRDLIPTLKCWCIRLEQYVLSTPPYHLAHILSITCHLLIIHHRHMQVYKYDFTEEIHVQLINLLFELFVTPDFDVGLQQTLATLLRRLIK